MDGICADTKNLRTFLTGRVTVAQITGLYAALTTRHNVKMMKTATKADGDSTRDKLQEHVNDIKIQINDTCTQPKPAPSTESPEGSGRKLRSKKTLIDDIIKTSSVQDQLKEVPIDEAELSNIMMDMFESINKEEASLKDSIKTEILSNSAMMNGLESAIVKEIESNPEEYRNQLASRVLSIAESSDGYLDKSRLSEVRDALKLIRDSRLNQSPEAADARSGSDLTSAITSIDFGVKAVIQKGKISMNMQLI